MNQAHLLRSTHLNAVCVCVMVDTHAWQAGRPTPREWPAFVAHARSLHAAQSVLANKLFIFSPILGARAERSHLRTGWLSSDVVGIKVKLKIATSAIPHSLHHSRSEYRTVHRNKPVLSHDTNKSLLSLTGWVSLSDAPGKARP